MTTARAEAARKSLHVLLSLVAAAAVWVLPPIQAATLLAAATFVALSIETARRTSAGFTRLFQRVLGRMLRTRETGWLTGATTLSIGYTAAAVLMPGLPALAGILYTGVADALAAVVGKRFGRRRYPGGKSVEGSAVFFAAVLLLSLLLPGVGVGTALTVAILLTLIEAPTLPVDDNLYLPLAGAAAVHLAAWMTGAAFFS